MAKYLETLNPAKAGAIVVGEIRECARNQIADLAAKCCRQPARAQ